VSIQICIIQYVFHVPICGIISYAIVKKTLTTCKGINYRARSADNLAYLDLEAGHARLARLSFSGEPTDTPPFSTGLETALLAGLEAVARSASQFFSCSVTNFSFIPFSNLHSTSPFKLVLNCLIISKLYLNRAN
jgi:hypothetical protein